VRWGGRERKRGQRKDGKGLRQAAAHEDWGKVKSRVKEESVRGGEGGSLAHHAGDNSFLELTPQNW
jgi:hypothetical protein